MFRKLIPPIILVVALILGFIVPDLIKQLNQSASTPDLSEYCMLSSVPCIQHEAEITLAHDIAKPLVPSEISVIWPDHAAQSLQLSLSGLEMEMGSPRYRLDRAVDGRFVGTILLPVCTQDTMTWIGTITDGTKLVHVAIRMER